MFKCLNESTPQTGSNGHEVPGLLYSAHILQGSRDCTGSVQKNDKW